MVIVALPVSIRARACAEVIFRGGHANILPVVYPHLRVLAPPPRLTAPLRPGALGAIAQKEWAGQVATRPAEIWGKIEPRAATANRRQEITLEYQ